MNDKEVGEYWKMCLVLKPDVTMPFETWKMVRLIHKLIEERVMGRYDSRFPRSIGLQRALKDFGIDPETYETVQ